MILFAAFAAPAAKAVCTLSFATLNFGTYIGTLETGVTPGTVNCSFGTAYTIGLDAGTGVGATEATRHMTGPGGATLSYQMFQDAARTVNWGNTAGVDTVAGTGTGGNQTIDVYAKVLAGQLVHPGTYTDTVSSATASFTVTAVVQATCTLSATALAFGTYTGAALNVTSTLTISCTNTTTLNIGLNAGTATGATVTTRKMTGPVSTTLNYALFRDSSHTLNWGNTVGTNTLSSTGNGTALLYSVFGQLAAGQHVRPGAYSDTIIVTVTY